jgi:hypothetical protein
MTDSMFEPMQPQRLKPEQWKHRASVADHCYRSPDLALRAIGMAASLAALPSGTQDEYLKLRGSRTCNAR